MNRLHVFLIVLFIVATSAVIISFFEPKPEPEWQHPDDNCLVVVELDREDYLALRQAQQERESGPGLGHPPSHIGR